MGTKIFESENGKIQANTFFGGQERGQCVQITTAVGYVQMTKAEFFELVNGTKPDILRCGCCHKPIPVDDYPIKLCKFNVRMCDDCSGASEPPRIIGSCETGFKCSRGE